MTSSSPVRGMRDFLPADKAARENVLKSIRTTFLSFGFAEIETPYMEELSRLSSNQGGDNEKMLFKVQRRGLDVAELATASTPDELCDIGLRYDLTLPLARYYANNVGKLPDVFRVMQIGPVWRAERPQKGRFRQFTQCDIDIIGDDSSLAEVELITVTVRALVAIGLTGLTLKLNDRRLLTALLRHVNAPTESWPQCLITIDKLDKIGLEGVDDELSTFLAPAVTDRVMECISAFEEEDFDIAAYAALIDQPEVADLTENLDRIMRGVREGVQGIDVKLRFVGSLVRGMGYYSGPIFELWHPEFSGAVSGGGRYDGMVGRFLGKDVPATGFSIGFERILELVSVDTSEQENKVALLYENGVDWGRLVSAQSKLVEKGYKVRLVPRSKRIGGALKRLTEEGFNQWAEVSSAGAVGELRELT